MGGYTNFRFYKRPRSLPINLWTMIFEGLGLQQGLIRDENTRETRLPSCSALYKQLEQVVLLQNRVGAGSPAMEHPVFTDRMTFVVEEGTVVGSDGPDFALSVLDSCLACAGINSFWKELE